MNDILKAVIFDYLEEVKNCIRLFQEKIDNEKPLEAWKKKIIPKEGNLTENIKYEFHGIGCLLIFPNHEVDFDFGPDGRYDGFDLWRLSRYVESKAGKYSRYHQNPDQLEIDFHLAIKSGEIVSTKDKLCALYFLR